MHLSGRRPRNTMISGFEWRKQVITALIWMGDKERSGILRTVLHCDSTHMQSQQQGWGCYPFQNPQNLPIEVLPVKYSSSSHVIAATRRTVLSAPAAQPDLFALFFSYRKSDNHD